MSEILASWRTPSTREAIITFVQAVTDESSADFVPPAARIAAFDNDGTLWCEKPLYIQLDYLLGRLALQVESEPSLQSQQPWKAASERDLTWFGDVITRHYQGDDEGFHQLLKGILGLSDGQPVEQVETDARAFIEHNRHPRFNLFYRHCIYQPMLELLRYLDAHGFKNYIVSGGGRDFMRGFAEDAYGIPRERVLGTTVTYHFDADNSTILQQPELSFIDDGPGKPIQIWSAVGRRPILSAGNSNGDIEMMEFTAAGDYPSLCLLVNHDDAVREYAYTAGAEQAIKLATENDWLVVNMQQDWTQVFIG